MTKKQPVLKQNSKYILSAGFASVLGLLVLLTAIWYTNIISTKEKMDNIVNNLNVKTEAISQMRDIARARALSLHHLRLIEDPFDREREYAIFRSTLISGQLVSSNELASKAMDKTESLTWEYAKRLIKIGETVQQQAADLIMNNHLVEADLIILNQVIPAQHDVLQQLTILLQLQKDYTKIELAKIDLDFHRTRTTITILGATVTVLGIFIALFVIKRTSMAEVVLLQASKNAQDANRLKSEFLAKMTHELRTPLNAIIGFSEVLKEDVVEDGNETYLQDLKKIETAGHQLLAIVNNVLDLSRIEANKFTLNPHDFSIYALVEDLEKTASPLAKKNNNSLKIICEKDIGIMYADEKRIRQAIFNLLSNAFKFSKNGVITLEVGRETSANQKNWVCFKVSDTGIGIDHSQIKKLFEPFIQLDSSINRRYGGAGLGLALAKRFCELMGGDILVHSEVSVGTTFTVRLPENMPEYT